MNITVPTLLRPLLAALAPLRPLLAALALWLVGATAPAIAQPCTGGCLAAVPSAVRRRTAHGPESWKARARGRAGASRLALQRSGM